MTSYMYLTPGAEIKAGDQMKRNDGTWVTIKQRDIDLFNFSTISRGYKKRKLTRKKSDLPIRRKLINDRILKGSKADFIIIDDPLE